MTQPTHLLPDQSRQRHVWHGDGRAQGWITSGGLFEVPAAGLTLGAQACEAYVFDTQTDELLYCGQSAIPVGPLNQGNGTYWLIIHRDLVTALFGWTRQPGTRYLFQLSATQPVLLSGTQLLAKVTVSGGAITAVQDFRLPSSFARNGWYAITDPLYGAVGNGVIDDTTALTNALKAARFRTLEGGSEALPTVALSGGALVYAPPGTYVISAQTVIGERVTLQGAGYPTVFQKAFDGYLFQPLSWSRLEDFTIDGQGSTYLGAGVLMSDGTNVQHRGRQMLRRLAIYDTESYNIEYVGEGVGYGSSITECDFNVHLQVVPAIKMPLDGANPGNRHVINCRNLFGDLADFAGCQNGTFIGNTTGNNVVSGNETSQGGIVFSGGSLGKKGIFVGNRFASVTQMTIEGVDHVFTGNVFGCPVELGTTAFNCRVDYSNVTVGAVVDNATNPTNYVFAEVTEWTPTWHGTIANPDIGNGVLRGRYHTNGKRTYVEMRMVPGTTTTFGTGDWYFGLPGEVSQTPTQEVYVGSVWMRDISVNTDYVGVAFANGSAINLVADGAITKVGTLVPFTWANLDELFISMSFDR